MFLGLSKLKIEDRQVKVVFFSFIQSETLRGHVRQSPAPTQSDSAPPWIAATATFTLECPAVIPAAVNLVMGYLLACKHHSCCCAENPLSLLFSLPGATLNDSLQNFSCICHA